MKDTINSDKKIDILISALEERYSALRIIRDRVQNTGVWILGILTGISGWLLQSDVDLRPSQQIVYIIAAFVVFIALRFHYLNDLNIGFKGQQRTTAKLEKSLGFFTPKFFDDSENPLYPESWEKAGTEEGEGKFFKTTFLLIDIGFVFLVLSILMSGGCAETDSFIYYSQFVF